MSVWVKCHHQAGSAPSAVGGDDWRREEDTGRTRGVEYVREKSFLKEVKILKLKRNPEKINDKFRKIV